MGIEEVAEIIGRIADGFEDECGRCLTGNSNIVVESVREQLYSGQDGEGEYLDPTYDTDPFFNEEGRWKGKSQQYKAWKREITPPQADYIFPLGLFPRPDNVPNLFINGKFYSEITATAQGDSLVLDPGHGAGPDIVEKYGDKILRLGPNAVAFFNENYMMPCIEAFFKASGYR